MTERRPDVSGGPEHRSGFVTLIGRPNVGKSTLCNRLVGSKVAIVSDKPQTTRNEIRGVLSLPSAQIVFLDTPGIHRPRTALGERVNETARRTLEGVDVVCLVIEASAPIGRGDRFIATSLAGLDVPVLCVVNKVDAGSRGAVLGQLALAQAELGDFDAYLPVSAKTGEGCEALVDELVARLGPGPRFYPDGVVTDQPESFLAAELLREKLLALVRDELPHSIAVVVSDIEERGDDADPLLVVRAQVYVERDSQKGIVIGRGGSVLGEAGTKARRELERLLGTRVHLDVRVRVERGWQRRAHALDRFGI